MNTGFSWKDMKERAIQVKIERAMTMAKKKDVNPDFKLQHPDWVSQAQNNNFTDLKKKVRQMVENQQAIAMARRTKVARKFATGGQIN